MSVRRLALVSMCAFVWVLSMGVSALATPVQVGTFGGEGSGDGQFLHPSGVAGDQSTGDVYVLDEGNARLEKFTSTGTFIAAWGYGVGDGAESFEVCASGCREGNPGSGAGQFSREAIGVAVDNSLSLSDPSAGDVYVADAGNDVIDKFDSSGVFLGAIAGTGLAGSASFAGVRGVTVDATGQLWVYEANGNVDRFDDSASNLYLAQWNTGFGARPGIAVDSHQNVYLVQEAQDVYKFSEAGSYDSDILTGDPVSGVAVDPSTDDVYVTIHEGDALSLVWGVYEYSSSGALLGSVGSLGSLGSHSSAGKAGGVAFNLGAIIPGSAAGALYVAVTSNDDVAIFAPPVPVAPVVDGESVANVGSGSARVSAQIDPGNDDTHYYFQYGTDTSYGGGDVPAVPGADIGAGGSDAAEGVTLVGLAPSTTYHFRVVAVNSVGAVDGADQTFTTFPVGGSVPLPDGRAYEQASPVDKNSSEAYVSPVDTRAAPSGDAVTFSSLLPFPGAAGAQNFTTDISIRGGGGWSTRGLLPKAEPGGFSVVRGVTEDLSQAFVLSRANSLTPEGKPNGMDFYSENAADSEDRLVAQLTTSEFASAYFVDASADDSHILFESTKQLLSDAAPFVNNLYEWDGSRLTLVGVLPGGVAPEEGSSAASEPIGFSGMYTQHTISDDGLRVSFTDDGTGRIYVREPQVERTIPVSSGRAVWRAMTPDGRYVFYTEGENLYRFAVEGETREALTSSTSGLLGVLGVSDDGSYVYFAATGALAGGATESMINVYGWHDGAIVFIASLNGGEDEYNWAIQNSGSALGGGQAVAGDGRDSRVTPDGQTLLLTSRSRLTSYDNAGKRELYLYSAAGGRLICVSCNPTGSPATSDVYLADDGSKSESQPPELLPAALPRNLSADGSRVFFDTAEALVPQDTNGATDVYEWEADGSGSCTIAVGCLYLISDGHGTQPSYFGDASTSGDDVFFSTGQALVGQDQDNNSDVYDARVGGGIAAQSPSAPSAPCSSDTCREASGSSIAPAVPASAAFSGAGNLAAPVASAPASHKTTAKAKKVKKKSLKKKRKKRRKGRKARSSVRVNKRVGGRR